MREVMREVTVNNRQAWLVDTGDDARLFFDKDTAITYTRCIHAMLPDTRTSNEWERIPY